TDYQSALIFPYTPLFRSSLPGFADSTPEFLRENLLSAGGAVRFDAQRVQAKLRRPPLDVLLGITGLADRTFELAGGRMLMLERRSEEHTSELQSRENIVC